MSNNDNSAKAIKQSATEAAESRNEAANQAAPDKARKPAKPKTDTADTGSKKSLPGDAMQSSRRVWPD